MKNKGIGDRRKNLQPRPAVSCSHLAVAISIRPGHDRVFGWCEVTLDVYVGLRRGDGYDISALCEDWWGFGERAEL